MSLLLKGAGAIPDIVVPPGNYWNPADKAPTISLSLSDRRATQGSAGDASVRGLTGRSSGKYYFEGIPRGSVNTLFGISDSALVLAGGLCGFTANSIGHYFFSGDVYQNSGVTAATAAYAVGDVLMAAVDLTVGNYWVGRNGVWSGDPAAGTGAVKSGLAATTYYPCVTLSGSGKAMDLYTTGLTYSPPSGFSEWG